MENREIVIMSARLECLYKYWPFFFIFPFLLLISLGRIFRWDLMDQVASADRFLNTGGYYPLSHDFSSYLEGGVSVYFPGVGGIAVLLNQLIPNDWVPYALHFLAVLLLVSMIFMLTLITKELNPKANFSKISIILIPYTILVCFPFVKYAVEFKPDVIALFIGITSLYIFNRYYMKSYFGAVILGGIAGIGIVFKQQYVAFGIGLLLVFFLKQRMTLFIYILSWFIVFLITLLVMNEIEGIWFWTIDILSDDGFLPLWEAFNLNVKTVLIFIVFVSLLLFFSSRPFSEKVSLFGSNLFVNIKCNIWWVILPVTSAAAMAGALKVGGNSGNITLGLFLLFPLIYVFFDGAKKNISVVLFVLMALMLLQNSVKGVKYYNDLMHLTDSVEKHVTDGIQDVLSGSNTYFSLRGISPSLKVSNYQTAALVDNSSSIGYLVNVLEDKDFDLLVVENIPENRSDIEKAQKYSVVFENKLGIVALLKKSYVDP